MAYRVSNMKSLFSSSLPCRMLEIPQVHVCREQRDPLTPGLLLMLLDSCRADGNELDRCSIFSYRA